MAKLIVTSKVKSTSSLRVSGNFADALDKRVEAIIKTAEERAKANGRATLRPCDI